VILVINVILEVYLVQIHKLVFKTGAYWYSRLEVISGGNLDFNACIEDGVDSIHRLGFEFVLQNGQTQLVHVGLNFASLKIKININIEIHIFGVFRNVFVCQHD